MPRSHLVTAIMVSFLWAASVGAQALHPPVLVAQSDLESDFRRAIELTEKHLYKEALPLFEKVMQLEPKEPSVLWNTGVTAQYCQNYPLALRAWQGMRDLEPENWKVHCKLVQVYQALGSLAERDSERSLLLELRKANPSTIKESAFCRDQFAVKNLYVLGYENFDFVGDRPIRYTFYVTDLASEKSLYRLSWGSYAATNQMAKEMGSLAADQKLFHLDYYATGEHRTYAFAEREPTYEEAKAAVIDIVEGKSKPLSSSKWDATPPNKKTQTNSPSQKTPAVPSKP